MRSMSYNIYHISNISCCTSNSLQYKNYMLCYLTNKHSFGNYFDINSKLKFISFYLNIDSFYLLDNQCNHHCLFYCHHRIPLMVSIYYHYSSYNCRILRTFQTVHHKTNITLFLQKSLQNKNIGHPIMYNLFCIQGIKQSCYTIHNYLDKL